MGDVDLHFDADRMLFSSLGTHGRWQVFEIRADGTGLRQVTPGDQPDVDNYDACYLPDGRIIFSSTASMAAVPCVNGSTLVANLYRMDADGRNIRQLCFDQEHNWCPTVMPNGRVLYLRWEYTDTPHATTACCSSMNPDGTGQMEFYGSNSYWPNSLFYARPIPGHPTKFVGIVSGHHGVPRMGELVLFDAAQGRREADGVVQRIPGRGKKVEPIIDDNLVDASWPKFLHPYPLSDKYFLVAAQPTPQSLWGIYLVDVFDNMVLLQRRAGLRAARAGSACARRRGPPVDSRQGRPRAHGRRSVYLSDVYAGGGLAGMPRGTVKQLRDLQLPLSLSRHGRAAGRGRHGRPVGHQADPGHRAGRGRRLGLVPRAGQHADRRAAAGRRGQGPAADAELVHRHAGRGRLVRRLPREPELRPAQPADPRQRGAARRRSRPGTARARVQLRPRGAAGARQVLRRLPRRPAARPTAADAGRPARPGDGSPTTPALFHFGGVDAGHFSTSYAELHRFVRRPGPGERLPHARCRWSSTPTPRASCRCCARGTTACSWTPRRGTG